MRNEEIVMAVAARQDYFAASQCEPGLSRRMAQITCEHLALSGRLIQVQKSNGPLPAKFASPKRLIRKCALAKLEAECAATRRTLKLRSH